MFLNMGSNEKNGVVEYNYVYDGQQGLSTALLVMAFICVPVMLCVKPLILRKQLKHNHDYHEVGEDVR